MAKLLCVLYPALRAARRLSTHEKTSSHWITIPTARLACWQGAVSYSVAGTASLSLTRFDGHVDHDPVFWT